MKREPEKIKANQHKTAPWIETTPSGWACKLVRGFWKKATLDKYQSLSELTSFLVILAHLSTVSWEAHLYLWFCKNVSWDISDSTSKSGKVKKATDSILEIVPWYKIDPLLKTV